MSKKSLKVGDRVKPTSNLLECFKDSLPGVVTKIRVGETTEDHGQIYVMQDNGVEEHYCYYKWQKFLKKI